jgi:hypothetical protein
VFDDGGSVLAVTLRDISPRGARIVGQGVEALPSVFELRIRTGSDDFSTRKARLIWARKAAAGLEFVD